MVYPCSADIQNLLTANQYTSGNFSLWFNKFVPIKDFAEFKACNGSGNTTEAVAYYQSKYETLSKSNPLLHKLLENKHVRQKAFCQSKIAYDLLEIQAKLTSHLITGIGQSHPNEVGMVFDHTLGIPYIPASSVKGIVRFSHLLEIIQWPDSKEFIEGDTLYDSNPKTLIPDFFGGSKVVEKKGKPENELHRGKVIFLDAYSSSVPKLTVDIMNPHYGKYYGDETLPPADNQEPTPIKFLVVKAGTEFTFRALVLKGSELKTHVKKAFIRSLTVEGVGAKTAVGYGRFEIISPFSSIKTSSQPAIKKEKQSVWTDIELSYTPNDKKITAIFKNKKASTSDLSLIPESMKTALLNRPRKAKAAQIEVETLGNAFVIKSIK